MKQIQPQILIELIINNAHIQYHKSVIVDVHVRLYLTLGPYSLHLQEFLLSGILSNNQLMVPNAVFDKLNHKARIM